MPELTIKLMKSDIAGLSIPGVNKPTLAHVSAIITEYGKYGEEFEDIKDQATITVRAGVRAIIKSMNNSGV